MTFADYLEVPVDVRKARKMNIARAFHKLVADATLDGTPWFLVLDTVEDLINEGREEIVNVHS